MKIREMIAYLIAILAVLAFGIIGTYYLGQRGGFNVRINSLLDATYFTLVTLSTIGYGDIYPVSASAKIFVIILIIVGIGVFFSTIVVVAGDFMKERVEAITGRMSAFEKRRLNKHIILIGTSSTNAYLAEKLHESDERFIIVTSSPENAEHMKRLGYNVHVADSTSEIEMREFEPQKSKAIVIDIEDSSRAIYALLVAKELTSTSKIIVISPSKAAEHHLRNISGGRALVMNPAEIAASTISKSIFK